MHKIAVGTRLRLAELLRQPLTLVTLIALPPIVIEMYGVAVKSFPQLPSLETDPATAGRLTGTLFAVAFLAGLVGLFQVISARKGDDRLSIAGFPRWVTLTTRLITMIIVVLAGAAVAFAFFTSRVNVQAPLLALSILVLAGLSYGLLGVIIGTFFPRALEGSIVLVFLADLDNALSSGLFPIGTSIPVPILGELKVVDAIPLYHPHRLFVAAVLEGELVTEHLLPVFIWIIGLLVTAFIAYGRSVGNGWSQLVSRWSE